MQLHARNIALHFIGCFPLEFQNGLLKISKSNDISNINDPVVSLVEVSIYRLTFGQ